MPSNKKSAPDKTAAPKTTPPVDPARRRYTEEEMDELIEKAWPDERVAAFERAENDRSAPIVVVRDFAQMRPQTARLAQVLDQVFPNQFKGVERGEWPPLCADDGMIDVIHLGRHWIVQLGYDGYEPSKLDFVNAARDGADLDEAYELDCGGYSDKGFDSYAAPFPLTDTDRAELMEYLQRNFDRPARKVVLDPEEDRYAKKGDRVVPLRKPS
ncbi:hypothetical protein AA23498_3606 [Acetobacter nitrogenifigens DSM 23921 = NBRC 105050]|uniref:Uncharacterized protein n=1 Tax=Acetobacter nitrogenifigens DSM 23921 = NBRC 105050 TaxID=1120919 RepID=A0A511XFE5_9PROT|nr:hypothetical protein [Acetobacter nitrogenifigens]GBR00061.1 hypothetical protein AA23498_3606 [Acetobacter nitrogenifigens DSM 23921 = NBRC 105050]GEN61682.1 hypothetical protein ANI02nite_35660 [Acetobacter nitrogenifigens DSM 23921 = NBRC 105050]